MDLRRDAQRIALELRFGLPLLRTAVLVGLLFVYLQPRWRSEREEHFDSRVLVIVDTSLSMGLPDADTRRHAPATATAASGRRFGQHRFHRPAAKEAPSHRNSVQ